MEKVAIEDQSDWMGPATVKRPLGDALGAECVAINYYELEPGESFAFGYHAHEDQEEVFYVLEGVATFETGPPNADPGTDAGTRTVRAGPGEVVRFEAGEWQQGTNEGDDRVRALVIGAPAEAGETTILRTCRSCGERTEQEIEPSEARDALVTVCNRCGEETGQFT